MYSISQRKITTWIAQTIATCVQNGRGLAREKSFRSEEMEEKEGNDHVEPG